MDLQKEIERWKGYFSIWFEEEPQLNQTYRLPIWKKNKATLWYYPAAKKRYKTPIYLIYSLVNQPFILDLYPGNSLIEAFITEGYDVYLIDFGIPGYEDKDITLDYYIAEYIQKGARQVLSHSQASELTVMGFCLGGTVAAIYASLAEEPIKNLILDVAPIDFSHWPIYNQWIKTMREEDLDFDEAIDAIGLIPSRLMEMGVRLITSPVYFSPYLSLLNKAHNEQSVERWRLFNKWTKGHIPLSGGVLKQLLNEFVKDNKLVKGTLSINNERVDLANINSNLLVIAAKYDRLVPKETTEKIIDLVSSNDKKYHVVEGGHATITIKGKLPDYLQDWLPERSTPL
jgi:polyhydroxyalkanoate synthase subunit PhaC